MKHFLVFITALSLIGANSIYINKSNDPISLEVLEQTSEKLLVKLKINKFSLDELEVDGMFFQNISVKGEPNFLKKGSPSLPHINRSIIIPESQSANINVLSKKSQRFNNYNILPSKGNVKRNVNIKEVDYEWFEVYNLDQKFPGNLVELHDPYILRDVRGQVIQFNPFQYNPIQKTLDVIHEIVVEIKFDGNNMVNEKKSRYSELTTTTIDYDQMYSSHFLNYQSYQSRYTPISEDGEMLIICYDNFVSSMQPLVDWKNQKGLKTTIIPKSTAGNSATSIKNYITNFYNSHNLAYVMLVGDKNQIPTFTSGSGWSSGESDISYAYISGNDSYPEFFVGRISAESTSHVNTQVERTIEYERDPQINADWYRKGIVVASNEGAGYGHDGGESDWEHARNMRDDLLDYNYNGISEFYDGTHSGGNDASGSPSASSVRSAINNGIGIAHYTGHGDTQLWVTSGFDNGDVGSLVNQNELPFICTVGCKSGDFGDGLCLGEAFLRETYGGEPVGAIATFMSTVYQGWAPPMEAQDEMVDILTESYSNNRKYTFGGISWNGCLKMNDAYGSEGYTETNHWTLFGDPSVVLRTKEPTTLNISHNESIDPNSQAFEVIFSDNIDFGHAALSHNGTLLGSGYADNSGSSIIIINQDISNLNEITLTATGYNTTSVVTTIQVGNPCDSQLAGDANQDTILNILDVVLVVNYVIGVDSPGFCQFESADMNQDEIINVLDIVLVVNNILG